ncbi:YhdP family protein [Niastella vici]|nr:AsmA-like C-terminal region-containing protein [Niastella vici]
MEISDQINGRVNIGNIELSFLRNFPHVSVLLQNVSITDSLFNIHHYTFFKGKEIFVSINVLKLINNQPPIKGIWLKTGELHLYTDSTGYTNTYLLRLKRDTSGSTRQSEAKNELKNLVLKDVRFIVDDRKKAKLYDLVINQLKVGVYNKEYGLVLSSRVNILVKSLAFNTARGSFVKDKVFLGHFNVLYQKELKLLSFDSINIQLSGQPFNLSAQFEWAGAQPQYKLRIHTHKVSYDFIKSALPQKLIRALSIVDINNSLDANAAITGPLKGGEPKVYVTWHAKDANLNTLFMDFEQATFSGFYSNEVVAGLSRKDPNSEIEINDFTARWHGLPVRSEKIRILNLYQPLLTCDLTSNFSLTKLNELIGSNTLYLNQGEGNVQLNYVGPLVKNDNTNSFLNGTVSFKNAVIEYLPRKVEMKKVSGKLVFKNSDVFVENLQCEVFNNTITMDGQAKSLLTLINTQPDNANINWNIHMPVMKLGAFLYMFKSKEPGRRQLAKKSTLQAIADKIDDFIERGRFQVKLNAGKLIYKDFEGRNALADITLLNDRYIINNVSMDHSGGHIALKGSLLNQTSFHMANLEVNMDNVDVRKVFAGFNNFGQDGLTAQSLEGKLSAHVEATMKIANDGHIIPSTIVSQVDFSLKDGALNNYEPIKKLQHFIFKKRNFDNIRFAELKDRLEISNQEVRINRMEIQSSVMSIFVEGVYSKKGTTDLSIQVPLSNLKKRDEDYNPENIGVNKKGGKSIFIRGRPGEDGNIKFKLDLFKWYNKEKKADTVLNYKVTG